MRCLPRSATMQHTAKWVPAGTGVKSPPPPLSVAIIAIVRFLSSLLRSGSHHVHRGPPDQPVRQFGRIGVVFVDLRLVGFGLDPLELVRDALGVDHLERRLALTDAVGDLGKLELGQVTGTQHLADEGLAALGAALDAFLALVEGRLALRDAGEHFRVPRNLFVDAQDHMVDVRAAEQHVVEQALVIAAEKLVQLVRRLCDLREVEAGVHSSIAAANCVTSVSVSKREPSSSAETNAATDSASITRWL